jgi:hypothetical protein
MTSAFPSSIVFRTEDLLPEPWKKYLSAGPVRAFNPGLLPAGDGWLLAYRVVGADGKRRIGLCRLDRSLAVLAGSPRDFSDAIRFRPAHPYPDVATEWFADPRLYQLDGRTFLYWNSGWHEPRNHQFLQEFDATTLRPLGHPRELLLKGERQRVEKNWTLFEAAGGALHAIYSILPHRVLTFSLSGEADIEFADATSHAWSLTRYPASHGGLRGGAPPVLAENRYWSFCHSVHDGPNGYRYSPAVYRFAPDFPFAPTDRPIRPLEIGVSVGNERVYEKLNPAVGEVIDPCGAAWDGRQWLVSHGINDERCAISLVTPAEVTATLEPIDLSA